MQKHYDPNKLPPIAMWKKELSEKTSQQTTLIKKSNTLRDEIKKVERIQRSVKEILRSEEQPQIKPKQRSVSMER